jgi:predicted transcriptional regulator
MVITYVNPVNRGSRKRRHMYDIIAEMLDNAMNGRLKTQIMSSTNLSFALFEKYLSFLLETELLKESDNSIENIYKTTGKGIKYLKCYYEIRNLLGNRV